MTTVKKSWRYSQEYKDCILDTHQRYPDPGKGFCECCGKLRHLITHHWYEGNAIPLTEHTRQLCISCNHLLRRENIERDHIFKHDLPSVSAYLPGMLEIAHHLMPSWNDQVSFVRLWHIKTCWNWYTSISRYNRYDATSEQWQGKRKTTNLKIIPNVAIRCGSMAF